jgi:hypothetical protein
MAIAHTALERREGLEKRKKGERGEEGGCWKTAPFRA